MDMDWDVLGCFGMDWSGLGWFLLGWELGWAGRRSLVTYLPAYLEQGKALMQYLGVGGWAFAWAGRRIIFWRRSWVVGRGTGWVWHGPFFFFGSSV